MLENALFALVRSTLLDGLSLQAGYEDVEVNRSYQPLTVGVSAGPQILMQNVGERRVGWLGRAENPAPAPGTDMVHTQTQWWETTLQIGAMAHRDPTDPDFLTLPSAGDICKMASDILQGDRGMALLAQQRVRPLRVTVLRSVQFVNDADQYEAYPSFDIVLSHVQIMNSTTPPVTTTEPNIGRV